jgi:hypothetical protein
MARALSSGHFLNDSEVVGRVSCDLTCAAVGDAQLFSVPDIKATSDTTQFGRLMIIRRDSKMKLCQSEDCVRSCIAATCTSRPAYSDRRDAT